MQVSRSMSALQLHGQAWPGASDGRTKRSADEFRLDEELRRRKASQPVPQVKEGEWVRAPRPQSVPDAHARPSIKREPPPSTPAGVSPYVARALGTYLSNAQVTTAYSTSAANGGVLDVYA